MHKKYAKNQWNSQIQKPEIIVAMSMHSCFKSLTIHPKSMEDIYPKSNSQK